jgi:hypothetical protein
MLWYVIESSRGLVLNERYYLNLNDIIKVGKIKFAVNELFLKKDVISPNSNGKHYFKSSFSID